MLFEKKVLAASTFAALTAVSEAARYPIQLVTRSETGEVNARGLSSYHEGAAMNYFFLGEQSESLEYDDETHQIMFQIGDQEPVLYQYMNDYEGVLALFPDINGTVTFSSEGRMSFNSIDSFFACMHTNDPYRYSDNSYQVVFNEINPECHPISIYQAGISPSNHTTVQPSATPRPNHSNESTTTATITHFEGGAAQGGVSGSIVAAGLAAVAMMLV